jgi:dihydropteroate synthase
LTVKRRRHRLTLRGTSKTLGERTLVMGVLNVTPDSFSDGGRFLDQATAVEHGLRLFEEGADIVDVGGESTRPGASPVAAEEERRRVVPVVEALRRQGAGLISIDTTKAEVARAAIAAGADLINDISGLGFDAGMAPLAAELQVPLVVMHLRGSFETVHRQPSYRDVMGEVQAELRRTLRRAADAGVAVSNIIVDPGIGFAKDAGHSLEVLARLGELHSLGRPVLVGPSRKSFIGKTLDLPVEARIWGTAAAVAAAVLGGAHIVRVHDVLEMVQVIRVCDALLEVSS